MISPNKSLFLLIFALVALVSLKLIQPYFSSPSTITQIETPTLLPTTIPTSTPAETFDFIKTGNIVKNNPGLKEDTWYLIYEEPGKPALSIELNFPANASYLSTLTNGQRVSIKGNLINNIVTVSDIVTE